MTTSPTAPYLRSASLIIFGNRIRRSTLLIWSLYRKTGASSVSSTVITCRQLCCKRTTNAFFTISRVMFPGEATKAVLVVERLEKLFVLVVVRMEYPKMVFRLELGWSKSWWAIKRGIFPKCSSMIRRASFFSYKPSLSIFMRSKSMKPIKQRQGNTGQRIETI